MHIWRKSYKYQVCSYIFFLINNYMSLLLIVQLSHLPSTGLYVFDNKQRKEKFDQSDQSAYFAAE